MVSVDFVNLLTLLTLFTLSCFKQSLMHFHVTCFILVRIFCDSVEKCVISYILVILEPFSSHFVHKMPKYEFIIVFLHVSRARQVGPLHYRFKMWGKIASYLFGHFLKKPPHFTKLHYCLISFCHTLFILVYILLYVLELLLHIKNGQSMTI